MKRIGYDVSMGAFQSNLLGVDIGSTTTRVLGLRVDVVEQWGTGRRTFSHPQISYRSPTQFTLFNGEALDLNALKAILDEARSAMVGQVILSGGVLVTGLAARAKNASELPAFLREHLGEAMLVTARDPVFESWLAFAGSVDSLGHSRELPLLNLDIGGGTTNPAWAVGDQFGGAGSYLIGARHLRFRPGSYAIVGLSVWGEKMLSATGVRKTIEDTLTPSEVTALVNHLVLALEDIVRGSGAPYTEVAMSPAPPDSTLVFSGGIGELIYRFIKGEGWPATTTFGDLGIDLAKGIVNSPLLSRDLKKAVPAHGGRATVFGVALKSTEMSGATVFLSPSIQLPLRDIPILSSVDWETDGDQITKLLTHPCGEAGIALVWEPPLTDKHELERAAKQLRGWLDHAHFPRERAAIILVAGNVGKTLGNYLTEWGKNDRSLLVIDEVLPRSARFVSVGAPVEGSLPVSFYGFGLGG